VKMRFNFKKNLTFLFLVSPLLLATCQKSPTGPQGIEDVYPLAVRNYWVYQGQINIGGPPRGEIREEIIDSVRLADNSTAFVKRKITSRESSSVKDTVVSYLQFVDDELREYLSKVYICKFKILLKLPLQPEAEWSTDACFCPACPLVVAYKDSIEALENINVPAGSFNDCYRIVTCNCPASIVTDVRWFAPYVGVTKFMAEEIWGTETYVLKKYRVR
ncbi:MAG: hypothetical protein ACRENF_00475, partial [Thermodesulfobacteriota bacterium]